MSQRPLRSVFNASVPSPSLLSRWETERKHLEAAKDSLRSALRDSTMAVTTELDGTRRSAQSFIASAAAVSGMKDFEELVSSLTPREDNDAISSYQNTTAVACPACEQPFDDMVVCKNELTSLNLDMELDLCTTINDGNVVLFTHKP
jgi:hypothetical protein